MAQLKLELIVDDKGVRVIDQLGQKVGDLGAKSSKAFLSAAGGSDSFLSSLTRIVPVVASLAMVYKAIDFGKQTLEEADRLSKLSKSTGIAAEELSVLKYASDLSGVSLDQTAMAISKMSRNMAEAAQGSGDAEKAFKILGLSVRNQKGELAGADEMLGQISDRFRQMPDGPTKAALAMQIFGKSGAEMIPLLNEGSAGLEKMRAEAEKLGLIISTDTAKAAEGFKDNMGRLSKTLKGSADILMNAYVPALEKATSATLDFLGITGNMAEKHLQQQKEAFEKQIPLLEAGTLGTGDVDKYLSWIPGYVTKAQAEQGVKEMKARIALINKTLEGMKMEGVGPLASSLVNDIRAPQIVLPKFKEEDLVAYRKSIEELRTSGMSTDTLEQEFAKLDAMRKRDLDLAREEGTRKNLDAEVINQKAALIDQKYFQQKMDIQKKSDEQILEEVAKTQEAMSKQTDLEKYMGSKDMEENLVKMRHARLQSTVGDLKEALELQQSEEGAYLTVRQAQMEEEVAAQIDAHDKMVRLTASTAEQMEKNFSSLFLDVMQGKLTSFADFASGIFQSIQKSASNYLGMIATDFLFGTESKKEGGGAGRSGGMLSGLLGGGGGGGGGMGGMLSGLFGGGGGGGMGGMLGGLFGGGGGAAAAGGAGSLFGGMEALFEFHKGGVVGETSGARLIVPESVMAGAKRYHEGLASDEIPAILQKGETVIPKGGGGGGGGITVNINNNAGADVSASQSPDGKTLEIMIERKVQETIRRNPGVVADAWTSEARGGNRDLVNTIKRHA